MKKTDVFDIADVSYFGSAELYTILAISRAFSVVFLFVHKVCCQTISHNLQQFDQYT